MPGTPGKVGVWVCGRVGVCVCFGGTQKPNRRHALKPRRVRVSEGTVQFRFGQAAASLVLYIGLGIPF